MDLIQAFHHEQWDFNTAHHPLSTTTTTVPTPCLPAVGAAMDYGAGGEVRAEVSERMEFQVATNQLSADDQSSLLPQQDQTPPMEDNCFNFLSSNSEYYRPKKVAKRQINNNINPISQYNPDHDQENTQDHGLILLKLLLECAVAISVDNLAEANEMLLELTQLASPYSPSCAERLVAHFAKAMTSRVMNSWLGTCTPLIPHKSVLSPFHAFNSISPFIKFAHFTSNQAILEASHHKDRIHIIDLDVMQGLQWPALFHVLATRIEGPPQIRLTGMGTSMEVLQETGRQLSAFAKRLGLSFEFQPVAKRAGDVDDVGAVVRLRRGEAVAVHWLQHSLYDAAGPDWKTMHLIQVSVDSLNNFY